MNDEPAKIIQSDSENLSFNCPVCGFLINVKQSQNSKELLLTLNNEKNIFEFIRQCIRQEFQGKGDIY
jgi:hypothetical protein